MQQETHQSGLPNRSSLLKNLLEMRTRGGRRYSQPRRYGLGAVALSDFDRHGCLRTRKPEATPELLFVDAVLLLAIIDDEDRDWLRGVEPPHIPVIRRPLHRCDEHLQRRAALLTRNINYSACTTQRARGAAGDPSAQSPRSTPIPRGDGAIVYRQTTAPGQGGLSATTGKQNPCLRIDNDDTTFKAIKRRCHSRED